MSIFNQQVLFKRRGVRGTLLMRLARLNYRYRAVAWIILALAALASLPQTSFAWKILGRELSWSMPAPDGWAGGNYYQIETAIQNTGNVTLRDLLRVVQDGARDVEATLIHLEDSFSAAQRHPSFSTRTLTEIVIRYSSYGVQWHQLQRSFASVLREDYPQGSVHLTSQSSLKVGQRMAHEAVFQIRLSRAASLYKSIIAVPVSSGGWLIFELKADSSRHEARLATLRQMLDSLRITEPGSTTKPWVPGHTHRKYAHVIATDKVDSYRPAPGYEWIDPDGPIGPVRWEPGQKHPQYAHVVSAEKEGYFQPEPGYEWDTPGKVGPVHRIMK